MPDIQSKINRHKKKQAHMTYKEEAKQSTETDPEQTYVKISNQGIKSVILLSICSKN